MFDRQTILLKSRFDLDLSPRLIARNRVNVFRSCTEQVQLEDLRCDQLPDVTDQPAVQCKGHFLCGLISSGHGEVGSVRVLELLLPAQQRLECFANLAAHLLPRQCCQDLFA